MRCRNCTVIRQPDNTKYCLTHGEVEEQLQPLPLIHSGYITGYDIKSNVEPYSIKDDDDIDLYALAKECNGEASKIAQKLDTHINTVWSMYTEKGLRHLLTKRNWNKSHQMPWDKYLNIVHQYNFNQKEDAELHQP